MSLNDGLVLPYRLSKTSCEQFRSQFKASAKGGPKQRVYGRLFQKQDDVPRSIYGKLKRWEFRILQLQPGKFEDDLTCAMLVAQVVSESDESKVEYDAS
jgi:hypothetical protein